MILYMAGEGCYVKDRIFWEKQVGDFYKRLNILESFYYIKEWKIPLLHKFKNFMLDSGAFTFMQNKKIKPDFEKYTYSYAKFINDNHVELFIEMDIDSVVELVEVERLRNILEKETGKKSIPVWHKSRGKQYFYDMCQDYRYIAIGGLVDKTTMDKDDYKYINWFCQEAHRQGCKVHGLGFTKINLESYHFDSVDSTAWIYGNRGKFLYEFNGRTMLKHNMNHKNNRLKNRETAIHNFMEWVKWGEYMEGGKCIFLAGSHSREYGIKGEECLKPFSSPAVG